MFLSNIKDKLQAWLGRSKTKTPVVLQMDATECGAAALGSILAFYGCEVSLETLRKQCEVSRHGCRADLMIDAAEYYGLRAEASTAEPEDLYHIPLPAIVHWKFEHYIVVEKLTPKGIEINDPANGHQLISWKDFEEDFTGIVLIFTPGPTFKKTKRSWSIVKAILTRMDEGKSVLIFIFLLGIALIIPGILIPAFSMIFINQILIEHLHGWIVPLVVGFFITAILRGLFSMLEQFIILKARMVFVLSSSMSFVEHLLKLPIAFFQSRYTGDIVERVTANYRVSYLLSNELVTSLVGLISMFFFAIIMLVYNWILAIVVILITAVNALYFYKQAPELAEASRTYLQHNGQFHGVEVNHISMIETIKSESLEDQSFLRWSSICTKMINSAHKLYYHSQNLKVMSFITNNITNFILIILGVYLIMQGKLTLGALVGLQSLVMSFQEPVNTILALGNDIQRIQGDLKRIDDIMNQETDPRLDNNKKNITELTGKVTINQLTFGYSSSEKALINELSVIINPQQSAAFVGASGSGKSTLLRLIMGLNQPWQGDIYYDDYLLSAISSESLAKFVALVSQDIFFFAGTVRDNLSMGNRAISDDDMIKALQDTMLYDALNKKNLGFCLNIMLEENASNLSTGQRQQLEIARALASKPKLLLLDEATANLDLLTEKMIIQNIKKRNITIIIVSHRLSIIHDCHSIYMFKAGKIVDMGTHDELTKTNAEYAMLVALESNENGHE